GAWGAPPAGRGNRHAGSRVLAAGGQHGTAGGTARRTGRRGPAARRGALADEPALVGDEDGVGGQDRRQPVGDNQRGAASQQVGRGGLDVVFGEAVKVGGGLVQDDDPRVAQDDPGDRQPLFSPPDSRWPRSSTTVSYPSGKEPMNSSRWAACAAWTRSASLAPGRA